MKVDIFSPPPPLPFGDGEERFELCIKRWDAAERSDVVDAFSSGSLLRMQSAIAPLVIAWNNVLKPDGTPLPLITEDERRIKRSNFDMVIGQLSLPMQLRVLGGIAEFIGVPAQDFLSNAEEMAGKIGDLRPTGARVNDTPATASGG